MDWEFFERWADVPPEERHKIIVETGNNASGEFIGLIMSIPTRAKLDALREGLDRYLQRNDK